MTNKRAQPVTNKATGKEEFARIISVPPLPGTKRAGRIEERDGKLYATHATETEQHAAV
jgi:hypothetical protein